MHTLACGVEGASLSIVRRPRQEQTGDPRAARPLGAARAAARLIDAPLLVALLAALALRLLLWGALPRSGFISDEGEYLSTASWLAAGRGFAWHLDYLWTRAPLYPLFLALHLRLFGESLAPIYATQTLLSLLNVALVYHLAAGLLPRSEGGDWRVRGRSGFKLQSLISAPFIAALLTALYFPLAVYPQVLLSETLYITLLLGSFIALGRAADEGRRPTADDRQPAAARVGAGRWLVALAGVLLGLATLVRSMTIGFVPLVALWLVARQQATGNRQPAAGNRQEPGVDGRAAQPGEGAGRNPASVFGRRWSVVGLKAFFLFTFSFCLVLLPWTVYNSRLFGGPILVDTSGGYNLLLGARTAYDGSRSDAPTRNFVLGLFEGRQPSAPIESCAPYPGPLPSQAARQSAMVREGLCLIAAKPTAFAGKSLLELVDLFRINYSGDERFTDGFTAGRLPTAYTLGLFLLDDTLYVLALPLAVLGWALARAASAGSRPPTNGAVAAHDAPHGRSAPRPYVVTLTGLWWLYNLAAAPLLFAINRFRLPLMPLAFIFAAYALATLLGRARLPSPRRGWLILNGALAALLAIVAASPFAYLRPGDQSLPSYLGPYPSSVASTRLALQARPGYLRGEEFRAALQEGDLMAASQLLEDGAISIGRTRVVPAGASGIAAPDLLQAILAGHEARPEDGLALLPLEAVSSTRDVEAAVVRGDLLRSLGDEAGARAAFTPSYVDGANPVQWAWDWLRPAPARRIDLGGNLDLGYVEGCYPGEGDRSLTPAATFRWCGDGARLRFAGAGADTPQRLVFRVDGRGWRGYADAVPPVQLYLGGELVGSFTPDFDVSEHAVTLPPTAGGADVVLTLRTPTFVSDAARYLSQQGALVGQPQLLGIRLDWAEIRP